MGITTDAKDAFQIPGMIVFFTALRIKIQYLFGFLFSIKKKSISLRLTNKNFTWKAE
jgi:hypothetical protein